MEKNWRDAIIRTLQESSTPLHYSEITEYILTNKYYKSEGATPAATVNAQMAASIKSLGDKSPFIRVSPGVFMLNEKNILVSQDKSALDVSNKGSQLELDNPTSYIKAFGMYWERNLVLWKNIPKLYGISPGGSESIDFSGQRGVYILYDNHTPIYVGRSTDQSVSQRMYQHTVGRLAGRWNRFSWFGLLLPTEDGSLKEVPPEINEASLITAFEAILIEALEPPQNRRQGDYLKGCEYIQVETPEFKKQKLTDMIKQM